MDLSSPQDNILNQFTTDVSTIFPDIRLNSGGYGHGFHVGTSGMNRSLRDSNYFIDPEGKEYFHLTSYRNLFSVINSGCLRLYNLKNSNDPNELDSFNEVGFGSSIIEHFKSRTFILSGCHIDDVENTDLWKEYGKVAIVYEFLNSALNWNNFHFAGIKYQTNRAFADFGGLLAKYKQKYPNIPFTYDTLPNLIAFHKTPSFEWEREVRLMYIPPFNPQIEQLSDFKTSKHHTGYTEYIELPLYVDSPKDKIVSRDGKLIKHNLPSNFYGHVPLVKIKKIIFGDNEEFIDQNKFNELRVGFQRTCQSKFGYRAPVDDQLFATGVKAAK